jgi:Ca2+-binding RTX toxin-like protein
MAVMYSGLGGPAGYGENVFSSTTKTFGNNDDGSVQVDATSVFGDGIDFFGNNYSSLYVNSNGNISFGAANTAYAPNLAGTTTPTVAAFWSDVDITKGGDIYWDLDPDSGKITITWANVRAYSGSTSTNNFQIVLTSLGDGNVNIEYVYGDINWTNGGSGTAQTGLTNGGGTDIFLPGSGSSTTLAGYETYDFGTDDPNGTTDLYMIDGTVSTTDLIVEGTGGSDLLDASYLGDPDGDSIGTGNDDIFGYGGDDTIIGGAGDDTIDAGDGDDTIVWNAGDGSDTIEGGASGETDGDTLDITATGNTTSTVFTGDGTGTTTIGGDTLDFTDIESFVFDAGTEDYFDASADTTGVSVDTGGGDDTVIGGSGSDEISGGAGNDAIFGGAGDDTIHGGDGDDVLYGDGASSTGTWTYEVWNYDFTSAHGQAFDAENGTLAGSGTTDGFDSATLVNAERGTTGDQSDFAVVYTSTLVASESGTFSFSTTSDDGSTIRIFDADGNLLTWTNQDGSTASYMDNDYHQGATTRTGQVALEEGQQYTIEVRHWENLGAEVISGTVTSPSGTTEDLADSTMILGPDIGAGDDVIIGGAGADTIFGGDGDDTLYVGAGDVATGGAGDDTFILDADHAFGGPGSTITIVGDEDGETGGDTLDFSGLIDWDSISYSDPESGTATLSDGTTVAFSNIENIIICFTKGTMIRTPYGERAIETLTPGDLVLTRDHGPKPLRWIGTSDVQGTGLLAPIRFEPGSLGNDRALLVSPQHRMLHQSSLAMLYFDSPEVMIPARHLINGHSIRQVDCAKVRYIHLLFDQHEVIWANGAPSESFHPGSEGIGAIEDSIREELFSVFPELRADPGRYGDTARMVLRRHEAMMLVSA